MTRRTGTDDPELSAMSTIRGALEPLDEATRMRVLQWLFARYAPPDEQPRITEDDFAPLARAEAKP